MNRLAIFDIDGTLTDSVAQHQAAFVQALEAFGFKNFNTDFGSYEHHTDTFIFKTIFEAQRGYTVRKKDIALFEERLLDLILMISREKPVREIAGAKSYMDDLKNNKDVDIVFATGSLLKPAKWKLEQAGIFIEEALLIASNSIFSRDEIVKTAINLAGQLYGKTAYPHIVSFGDGQWDYETAQRLNIDFVGIANEKLQCLNPPQFYLDYKDSGLAAVMNMDPKLPSDFNFTILSSATVSKAFTDRGIHDFKQAIAFVKQLPYKRNANKYDLTTVLNDGFGTCSTKHALLKQLAIENGIEGIRLMLCIFKMNASNTPKIAGTLRDNGLEFILEAHNYLLVDGMVVDCTTATSSKENFLDDTIKAIEIEPLQINAYKVDFHKAVLQQWLYENTKVPYSLDELFAIREKCIEDLSSGFKGNKAIVNDSQST